MTHLIQGSIDEPAVAGTRAGDPWTSQLAAMGVNVCEKQKLALLALREKERHGGAPFTAQEIADQAQRIDTRLHPKSSRMGGSTIRTRLKELARIGMVLEVDRNGHTDSKRPCTRYRLTPMGRDEAKEVENARKE